MTISWLNKLRKLNPNRSRAKGAAPHKPGLLLSLLDMAQDGELQSVELKRTPGMHVRFNAFSSIALPRWGGKVDMSEVPETSGCLVGYFHPRVLALRGN